MATSEPVRGSGLLSFRASQRPEMRGTENENENEEGRADSPTTAAAAVTSPEQYIKHPLQHRWALWYFKNDKSKSWTENLRLISKFDTVEDFWALYNHIQQPSKLGFGCDYCLFKLSLRCQLHTDCPCCLQLLCLIGESFDEASEDVCGAVVNVRPKGDKISIWTGNCQNRDAIMTIGQQYKERLSIPIKTLIGYQSHDDTSSKSGSTTKNMYSV
ncbi:eukaryotic translation initiation factor 4E-like [Sinocyclocheilus grahami]|uniref:Eukaryotic translation initiation factor 4E-like n=1 Tax=Sinocyclocheilus grahami TaxID=75366 RepID=A0A672LA29_SINGR|nr:PREDICTED: eukaryotic translation initiation factor 4E-like [Sinocyclocheilus grahami]